MNVKLLNFVKRMSKIAIYAYVVCYSLSMALAIESEAQRKMLNEITVHLDHQEVELIDLIKEIEQSTSFIFAFSKGDVKGKSVHLDGQVWRMNELLKEISVQARLSFRRVNESINVRSVQIDSNLPDVVEKVDIQRTVSGIITDEAGEPLPGATIQEKGTTNGTITDVEGRFLLEVPEDATLTISFVGYVTREISLNGRTVLDVSLEADVSALEEVVVVGYGTQKKSDVTGAVTSLRSDDFNQGVVSSPQDLIAGKVSGVQVIQNSAEPGGGFSVSIRGVSSINAGTAPLYVIDGMPIDNSPALSGGASGRSSRNPMASINPNDIESIEILKDASATAIYGARAANGVILITTKSGKSGKTKVNYDFYAGVQKITKKLDVLTPVEYQTVLNDLLDQGATNASEFERVTSLDNGGTHWQDEVLRDGGVMSHNLSVSGGNEKTNYFLGLNYFNQEGVLKKTSFERYGLRLNVDNVVSDQIKLGVKLNTTFHNDEYVPGGLGGNDGGVLYAAYNYDPSISIYEANGDFARSDFMAPIDNPIALLEGKKNTANAYRTFGTLYGEYNFLPDFKLRVNIGADAYNQQRDSYTDRSTLLGLARGGSASIQNGQRTNYLFEGLLTYSKNINDDHRINVLLGNTYQRFVYTVNSMQGYNYPIDVNVLETFNLGSSDALQRTISSGKNSNSLLSYLTRVNYALKDKYLLTVSYRMDGSSRFGENNKFGHFPSAALAWRIDNEEFFTGWENILSTMKLRTSWGTTGNEQIGNYEAITTFNSGGIAVLDDDPVATLVPSRISNPDLKWETTEQFNVGFDFGVWQDRVYGSIDWYSKSTYDMLLNLPIPTSTGYTNQTQNVGGMKNSGLEFSLTSRNIDREFKWETNISITTLKNKVTNLSSLEQIIGTSAGFATQIGLIEVGLPVRSFYGYQVNGIWQNGDDFSVTTDNVQPGDFKYADINGDSTVNGDDRVVLGNSFPKLMWSLTNTFSYKGFQLYVYVEAQQGMSVFNGNAAETYYPIDFRRNKYAEPMLNRWTAENPTNDYPSFLNPLGQGEKYVNSRTIEDASYVRLNTIKLTYNLPFVEKVFSLASVYVSAQNLLTLTDYSGIDPAINPHADKTLRIDYNAYPFTKTFIGGLTINF